MKTETFTAVSFEPGVPLFRTITVVPEGALVCEEITVWRVGNRAFFCDHDAVEAWYFDNKKAADDLAASLSLQHSSTTEPMELKALVLSDGRVFLQTHLIVVDESPEKMLIRNALSRLSDGEKIALGLAGAKADE